MYLADTSAWTNSVIRSDLSDAFRTEVRNGRIATCPMVQLELLWTARHDRDFRALLEQLEALHRVPIDGPVWERATEVFGRLAAQGPLHHRQVRIPDLLIAAAAESAELPVLHYDRDFDAIAAVTGQAVRPIAPLGSL